MRNMLKTNDTHETDLETVEISCPQCMKALDEDEDSFYCSRCCFSLPKNCFDDITDYMLHDEIVKFMLEKGASGFRTDEFINKWVYVKLNRSIDNGWYLEVRYDIPLPRRTKM